jgi:hypothetical protein
MRVLKLPVKSYDNYEIILPNAKYITFNIKQRQILIDNFTSDIENPPLFLSPLLLIKNNLGEDIVFNLINNNQIKLDFNINKAYFTINNIIEQPNNYFLFYYSDNKQLKNTNFNFQLISNIYDIYIDPSSSIFINFPCDFFYKRLTFNFVNVSNYDIILKLYSTYELRLTESFKHILFYSIEISRLQSIDNTYFLSIENQSLSYLEIINNSPTPISINEINVLLETL